MTFYLRKPAAKAHKVMWFTYMILRTEEKSVSELARAAGIGRTTFRKWWQGERSPTLIDAEAFLNVLGYTLKASPLIEETSHGKTGKNKSQGASASDSKAPLQRNPKV